MKRFIVLVAATFVLISSFSVIKAEGNDIVKTRIENSLKSGNFTFVEDLLCPVMNIRLGENLYSTISNVTALSLLNTFFEEKEIVSFTLHSSINSGDLVYKENGKEFKVPVDLYFMSNEKGSLLVGMNISDYPSNRALDRFFSKN